MVLRINVTALQASTVLGRLLHYKLTYNVAESCTGLVSDTSGVCTIHNIFINTDTNEWCVPGYLCNWSLDKVITLDALDEYFTIEPLAEILSVSERFAEFCKKFDYEHILKHKFNINDIGFNFIGFAVEDPVKISHIILQNITGFNICLQIGPWFSFTFNLK